VSNAIGTGYSLTTLPIHSGNSIMPVLKSLIVGSMRTASALFSAITFSHMAFAQETLFAYGSGGPAPAMKEAAIAF
jgi:hypothetical protein